MAADALGADLLGLTSGRSTVLITHRLAGLEAVDEVLVLDAGRVVERGTHDQLLAAGGRYADLWRQELQPSGTGVTHSLQSPRPVGDRFTPTPHSGQGRHPVNTDLARWQFATTSIYHFLFVPVTIGLAFLVAVLQTVWYRDGDRPLQAPDQVLRDAAAHQRGRGGGHRAGPGVRVRHELVGVLALRRRRLRRPAGHGGPGRLLPRVHVPRTVDLRLGPALQARPPGLHLDGRRRDHVVGRCSSWRPTPGCSTRSATRSTRTLTTPS